MTNQGIDRGFEIMAEIKINAKSWFCNDTIMQSHKKDRKEAKRNSNYSISMNMRDITLYLGFVILALAISIQLFIK